MYFEQLFDENLAQYSYLIGCQETGEAIVIDHLRDIDQYKNLAQKEGLTLVAAADTHIHADYLSGLHELAADGMKGYLSDEGDDDWKYEWATSGDYNIQLMREGDSFSVGNIKFDIRHTPGHTPESISFVVTDKAAASSPMGILTGDFVFVGDVGRPDLLETAAHKEGTMKPAAKTLYHSVSRFKNLPNYLQVWPGHGSGSACGKAMGSVPISTVGYELQFSTAFKASKSENQFVAYILDGQPEPPLYFGRMKKINKEGPAILQSLPKPPQTSIEQVAESNATLIDTRDRQQFMKRHLQDSLSVSLDKNFNTVAGSYVDPQSDICLIINEKNVDQAVRNLVRVGLDCIKGYITIDALDQYNGPINQIEAIDFEDVEQLRTKPEIQVVDVRSAEEYSQGHIPDSIHSVYTQLPAHLNELPQDKTLLVHCGSGQRASYASSLLAKEGFTVQWVDDYFYNWEQSNASG